MPGGRKVEEYLEELEALHERVREEENLSEKLLHTQEATKTYVEFRKRYQKDDFQMHVLKPSSTGKMNEKPFDWKSLDGDESL